MYVKRLFPFSALAPSKGKMNGVSLLVIMMMVIAGVVVNG